MLVLVLSRSSNRPVPSSVPAPQLASTVSAALCLGEAGQGSGGVAVGMPDEGASTAIRYVTLYGPTHDDTPILGRPGSTASLGLPCRAERCRATPLSRAQIPNPDVSKSLTRSGGFVDRR